MKADDEAPVCRTERRDYTPRMARASYTLIRALRQTATRVSSPEVVYDWAHFAHCNCGHLAQTITGLSPANIYRAAISERGDWAEQAVVFEPPDYGDRPALDEGAWEPEDVGRCAVTDHRMSDIFARLLDAGLEQEDIANLERLADTRVRQRLGNNTVSVAHGERDNVVAYLNAWADLLEDELAQPLHTDELSVAAE